MDINDIVKQLTEYLNIDYSEQTELCEHLIGLLNYLDYTSDDFRKAVEDEIKYQLNQYQTHSKIVEEETVIPEKVIKNKSLEWL